MLPKELLIKKTKNGGLQVGLYDLEFIILYLGLYVFLPQGNIKFYLHMHIGSTSVPVLVQGLEL